MQDLLNNNENENKLLDVISTKNKPAVVEVRAKWSGDSHIMDLIINKIEEEFLKQIKVIRIDFEINKELLSQFGVESAPAVLLICKGQVVEVIKETLSRKNLKKLVRDLIIRNSTSIEERNPVITGKTK